MTVEAAEGTDRFRGLDEKARRVLLADTERLVTQRVRENFAGGLKMRDDSIARARPQGGTFSHGTGPSVVALIAHPEVVSCSKVAEYRPL
jgi:hypothetical protein